MSHPQVESNVYDVSESWRLGQ